MTINELRLRELTKLYDKNKTPIIGPTIKAAKKRSIKSPRKSIKSPRKSIKLPRKSIQP